MHKKITNTQNFLCVVTYQLITNLGILQIYSLLSCPTDIWRKFFLNIDYAIIYVAAELENYTILVETKLQVK